MKSNKPKISSKTNQPAKVFDVLRPGKAIASPTSRPVVGRPKPVKDSTVLAQKLPHLSLTARKSPPLNEMSDERPLIDAHQKANIAPAEAAVSPAPPPVPKATASSGGQSASFANAPVSPAPASAPHPQEAALEDVAAILAQQTPQTPAVQDRPVEVSTAPATTQPEAAPEPAESSQDVLETTAPPAVDMSQAVISSRISSHPGAWRSVLVVVGLLLFVVAMCNILLDTGILKIQGIPHTHLFMK